MKVFQEVRGTFRCMTENLSTSSIVSVTGLTLPPNNVYVSAYNVTKAEKISIVQCFNNTNHLYAFGSNPEASNYAVVYNVFMQDYGCSTTFRSSGAVASLLAQYKEWRVSSKKKIVSLTIDTGAMVCGVLTGLMINVVDQEQNLVSVTLSFVDLDANAESGKGKG